MLCPLFVVGLIIIIIIIIMDYLNWLAPRTRMHPQQQP